VGVLLVVLGVLSTGMLTLGGSASAAVTSVKGSACAYISNVGLFGGPQAKLGCAPQAGTSAAPANASTLAPSVALPPEGSATPITATDVDGSQARYGPATITGGIWPENVASPTPSGPESVSTQGTPAGGTVTSSADITLKTPPFPEVPCYTGFDPPCTDPGGFGPPPVWGDSLHAECTATETSVTGLSRFSNSFIATATDAGGSPLPSATEPIPNEPPVNYTKSGVITNVGDVFAVVFNQQIVNSDGSLTVNAVHMYLFGPTAVGELIRGQVTCGTTPTSVSGTDTVAPACSTPVVEPMGPEDPTPKDPLTVRIGTFDAGGLQTVETTQATNATVNIGSDDPSAQAYLRFVPGQTGALPITAVRTDASQPMAFTFVATDTAGNKTTVAVTANGTGPPTVTCTEEGPDGSTTSSSSTTATTGGTGTTVTTGGTGTTVTTGGTGTTVTTGGTTTTSTTTVPPATSSACGRLAAAQAEVNSQIDLLEQGIRVVAPSIADVVVAALEQVRAQVNDRLEFVQQLLLCSSPATSSASLALAAPIRAFNAPVPASAAPVGPSAAPVSAFTAPVPAVTQGAPTSGSIGAHVAARLQRAWARHH
jgi:hypothetical protein